jgi:HSP20 family protein
MYTFVKFFDSFQDEIDDIFNKVNKELGYSSTQSKVTYKTKNDVDTIKELDNSYIIRVIIPGFEREEISLSIKGKFLTIEGKNTDNSITKEYYIPENGDKEKIEATLKNGILTVTMPKKVETKFRIDIK